MCLIIGRWNICFSHCYQLNVYSAHPAHSRPVLSGRNQGSLPWDSPFFGNAHRIFSFLFLRCTRKILPWGNIKGFPDISQRNRCTYIWSDKNGGNECSGHSPSILFPIQQFYWFTQKTSIHDHCLHNKLERLSLEFKFLHNLAPTDLSDHICSTPIQDPARLRHLLFSDPQPKLCACLCAFLNLKWSSLQSKCPNSWHPKSSVHSPMCEDFPLPQVKINSHSSILPLQVICFSLMVFLTFTLAHSQLSHLCTAYLRVYAWFTFELSIIRFCIYNMMERILGVRRFKFESTSF